MPVMIRGPLPLVLDSTLMDSAISWTVVIRRRVALVIAGALAVWPPPTNAQKPPTVPAGIGTIRGTVTDSIHGTPLVGAIVMISGVTRIAQTAGDGSFAIDSIPPGSYRVTLSHPLLDTI